MIIIVVVGVLQPFCLGLFVLSRFIGKLFVRGISPSQGLSLHSRIKQTE
jgi:hypothetical protein